MRTYRLKATLKRFTFIPNDFTLLFSLYFIEGVYYDPTGTLRFQAGFN